jgi:hypothetical protein
MNTILNAFLILARAQLVDPCPEASASDPKEETGMQLTTFRTHSAPDPIAEPLFEPPLVHPFSESEKVMMYGSSVVPGHSRGTSSVRFTSFSWVLMILRLKVAGLDNNCQHYLNVHGRGQYVLLPHHGKQLSIVCRAPPPLPTSRRGWIPTIIP